MQYWEKSKAILVVHEQCQVQNSCESKHIDLHHPTCMQALYGKKFECLNVNKRESLDSRLSL